MAGTFFAVLQVLTVLQRPSSMEKESGGLGRSPSRAMLSVTGSIMEASGLALSSLSTLYTVQMITNGACGFVNSLGKSGSNPAAAAATADGTWKPSWEAVMGRMRTAFVGSTNGGPSLGKLCFGLGAGLTLRVVGAGIASDRTATAVEKFVQDPFSIFAQTPVISESDDAS